MSTFRKLLTRRIALALAAASTVLFGWVGQPNATVVHYTIAGGAVFDHIPNPPPTHLTGSFSGSFDFDAATDTQSNVILDVKGLDPGLYAAVFPRSGVHLPSSCALCDILSGRPPKTDTMHSFTEEIIIVFAQPLGNPLIVDPITRVVIFGFRSFDPCFGFPGCLSSEVFGEATPTLARAPIPEPTSFAVFAPASVLCPSFCWANRRRRTRRFSRTL